MKTSKSVESLYAKHKAERQNFRLSLDLKKHNWLLDKLKRTDTKPTKREINTFRRLNKKMQNVSGKVVIPAKAQTCPNNINNTSEKLQKITNNNKTVNESNAGQCMFDKTDIGTTKEPNSEKVYANKYYQDEPLALLNKPKLNETDTVKSQSFSLPLQSEVKKPNLKNNKLGYQLEKPSAAVVNMVQNAPKRIIPKAKNWFQEEEQILCKHNLPLSVVPEMLKYRNRVAQSQPQPTNLVQKLHSRESQTDFLEDITMIQFLHDQKITTVEKLKDIIERFTSLIIHEEDTKMLAFLRSKVITLEMLTEIISGYEKLKEVSRDDKGKLKEEEGDEVEFVKEEIIPKKEVAPEVLKQIDSVVAVSAVNKKLINLCSSDVGMSSILTQIANLKYNSQANNKLEEAQNALTNKSVNNQELASETNTVTINKIRIPPLEHKKSYSFYDAVENDKMEVDDGHLVTKDNDKQFTLLKNIGDQAMDGIVDHVKEDIASDLMDDAGYMLQITEENIVTITNKDNSYHVTNPMEEPVVQEKTSPLVFQDPENDVVSELNIDALTVFAIPKSTNADSKNITKRTPYARRGRSQMGAGVQQMMSPPEVKRRYQLRDPRYKNYQQKVSMKADNVTQLCPRMSPSLGYFVPPTPYRQIHPNAFNNGTAGPVNQNMGFDATNEIGPNGPYNPSNQNDNNFACGINNQCSRNPAGGFKDVNDNNIMNAPSDRNSQNYDNIGYGPNAQYANSVAYSQNNHPGVIKQYGPHGQNSNVPFGFNNQSAMKGGIFAQNSQAGGIISAQGKKTGLGGVGRHAQNYFYNSHNSSVHTGTNVPNIQNTDDSRGSMEQNNFWGSTGQHLPPTTVANTVGSPLQRPVTSMGNLTGHTENQYPLLQSTNLPQVVRNQSSYPARMSPNSSHHANIASENLWHSRRWPQM